MKSLRRSFVGFGVVILLSGLAGCSHIAPEKSSIAESVERGAPDWLEPEPSDFDPVVTWIDRGETFAVVTWGSSICPVVATQLEVESDRRLTVTFDPPTGDTCTDDLAPTTHVFELPVEVTHRPVAVGVIDEQADETHALSLD